MRNQQNSSPLRKWAIYVASATIGGMAAGVLAGLLGLTLAGASRELTVALLLILGAVGVYIGAKEASGRRVRIWQINVETPQRWMHHGPVLWPLMNGFSLGLAFTSRLGYAVFYIVPVAAVASRSITSAVLIWGVYSFARAVVSLPYGWYLTEHVRSEAQSRKLIAAIPRMRRVTAFVVLASAFASIAAAIEMTSF